MTTITLAPDALTQAAPAVVCFARSGEDAPVVSTGTPALDETLTKALAAVRATGKADELTWLPGVEGLQADAVAVVGLGVKDGETLTAETLRRAAGVAGRAMSGRSRVVVLLPDTQDELVEATVEGLRLGAYAFTSHRGEKALEKLAKSAPAEEFVLTVGAGQTLPEQDAIAGSVALAERVCFARDLVNMAPNVLTPERFAQLVQEAAPAGVKVTVYDVDQLRENQCGGLLAVGMGSTATPRLVHLEYAPEGAQAHLAYVGKGMTFDSGGLCIKPAGSMITMKCDMGGAAAVAGAVLAIADREAPVAVDGWLCLAENMPSGDACRPGDVITMADGTTCEIINTDAEGRLVLADGIVLAGRRNPDAIVDVATLTGAAMVALGNRTAAVMANDEEFQGELTSAAVEVGEQVWPMPIPEEIPETLKSDVADRKHTGSREGGALVAAAFLREFAGVDEEGDSRVWGHLDIAGPAWNDGSARGYTPKGGTGFAVRTLVNLAESRS